MVNITHTLGPAYNVQKDAKESVCSERVHVVRALLHSETVMRLRRHCDIAATSFRMGCKAILQATDKFNASIDADTWCNSTGQNPYILIWERSCSGVANAGCKRALTKLFNIVFNDSDARKVIVIARCLL